MTITPEQAFQLIQDGLSTKEIGKKFGGISRQRVQQILSAHPPYQQYRDSYATTTAAQVRKLAAKGLSADLIASQMDRKISYVRYVAAKENISLPRKRTRYVGKRYGRWTVLRELGYRDSADKTKYSLSSKSGSNFYCLCRCTCGKEAPVATSNLIRGFSRSCASCSRKARPPRTSHS